MRIIKKLRTEVESLYIGASLNSPQNYPKGDEKEERTLLKEAERRSLEIFRIKNKFCKDYPGYSWMVEGII